MKLIKYILIIWAISPALCFAQIFSKADTIKSKEIQTGIIKLMSKAANNFKDLRREELKKDQTIITYKAIPVLKMHAQNYSITHSIETGKNLYLSYYTDTHAMNLALICLGNMTTGNRSNWITTEAIFDDKDLQGAWLRYKGAVVGQVIENTKEKTLTISIGAYEGEVKWIKEKNN